MIAFDLAYELTLGLACAGHARRAARGWAISAFVYLPFCVASLVAWPGWQAMYFVDLDARSRLAWASGAQVALLLGAYALGLSIGAARARAIGWMWIVVAWAVLVLVLFVVLRERAFTVTSYAEFCARPHARAWEAPDSVLGGAVMWFLIASAAVNGAALAWLLATRSTPST